MALTIAGGGDINMAGQTRVGATGRYGSSLGTRKRASRTQKQISAQTRELVLLEAAYMCASPACRHVLTLELHHIVWIRDRGGNEPSNIIVLCANCHIPQFCLHIKKTGHTLFAACSGPGARDAGASAANRERPLGQYTVESSHAPHPALARSIRRLKPTALASLWFRHASSFSGLIAAPLDSQSFPDCCFAKMV